MRSRFALLWIVLLFTCGLVSPQTQPVAPASTAQPENPVTTLHATSRLVLVDVVVTDKKGEFVQGLKPGDFTILEDGKAQRIFAFNAHSFLKNAGPEQKIQLPPNQYTNFTSQPPDRPITIVLLDMLNTERMDQVYARGQMIKFLEQLPQRKQ